MSEPIVKIEHIRRAREVHGGFCSSGIRAWCERHELDYRKLLREGLPLSEMEEAAPGDALLARVSTYAREAQQ